VQSTAKSSVAFERTLTKRTRKPSAALRESASSEKTQKRRHDPETAAMLANCDFVVEEELEEPPKKILKKILKKGSKKGSKKFETNKAFFTAIPRAVDVHSTSFLF